METTSSLPTQMALIGKWDLYYHLPHDKNWELSSYKKIMSDIDSVEKLIAINESLPEKIVKHCMLFVMRSGILLCGKTRPIVMAVVFLSKLSINRSILYGNPFFMPCVVKHCVSIRKTIYW